MVITKSRAETLNLASIPVVILVGGLGTRAREVTKGLIPKHLIQLTENWTIIDFVCVKLQEAGFRQFVFCVGYRKKQIINHITRGNWIIKKGAIFSFLSEEKSLGPGGAVYQALRNCQFDNPATILSGDMFIPWSNLEEMNKFHLLGNSDITFGLTSKITKRTTDVGKILIDRSTRKLIKCYGRNEEVIAVPQNAIQLTSAGTCVLNPERYIDICRAFLTEHNLPDDSPISIRDDLLPWIEKKDYFTVRGFDLGGEALDIGTAEKVAYARANWKNYMVTV